jgi:hypothetical protein
MHERRRVVTGRDPVAVDEEGRVIRREDSQVTTAREIAPGRVLAVIAGAVLTIVGAIVLVRTGLDSSLQTPSTKLLGASHTAIAGIVEVVCGLLLLMAGAARDQTLAALPAVLLAIAGIVALAAGAQLRNDLGAQDSTGWFLLVFAIISFLCAAMPIAHHMRTRREIL